jgi:hypothetical protein
MWMDAVEKLFAFVCCGNEARSFVINGQVLPFCQRCTGVFLGLAITFACLLAGGRFRRGLVGGRILVGNLACVGVMVVFGLHWIDPGPAWRLWSGLVFGNAVAWLVLPATVVLWRGNAAAPARGHSLVEYLVLLAVLSAMPLWLPAEFAGAYAAVCGLAVIGAGGVVLCGAAALAALFRYVVAEFMWKGAEHAGD